MNLLILINTILLTYFIYLTYRYCRMEQKIAMLQDKFYEYRKSVARAHLSHEQQSITLEQELNMSKKQLKKLQDDSEVARRRLDLHEEQVRKLQPRIYRDMKKAPARTRKNITFS